MERKYDNPQDVTSTVGITVHMVDGIIKNNGGRLSMSQFYAPVEKCKEVVDECIERGYL